MNNGEIESNITKLLVIAENHTVQIGIMMKAFIGAFSIIGASLMATALWKVFHMNVVGGN